jgi:pectate lyase
MKHLSLLFALFALLGMNAQAQNDVIQDATKNQVQLKLTDGSSKFYNTAEVQELTFDNGVITAGQDQYNNNVAGIAFAKAIKSQVNITEAKGWLESAYVKFDLYDNIQKYNVYVKGGQYNEYAQIDSELVRNYGTYGRADVVGLQAGTNYQLKVVPVNGDNAELTQFASETEVLEVKNYSREGFAFMNSYTPGAYKADGTLKDGAKVLYITKNTAKTVRTKVKTGSKDTDVKEITGFQAILDAYQKGYDTTPITFRLIGLIEKDDLDGISSSEEGIQIKGKNKDSEMPFTIEGIGDDATVRGFGFLVRNSKGVEFRNFAVMRCMDDGLSLDTDNSNIWIHHMDFFYGPNGGGDHAKGDGSCDVKSDSKYVTVSYNRFWDTGKTNMFGMKSESGPNWISYDHNWFDHSDSRHPRVRTMSVHVWNNYFDNVAKYGVGATSGSSVFVENNYFLKTKKPILSSRQGTDALGSGTFSGEDGGMIKAFGNYFDKTAPHFSYYTQKNPASTGYDAYETATRSEQIPATEKTREGGTDYDNFDTTESVMYEYDAVAAEDVPALVTGYYGAGRLNHGDFSYTFPDNVGSDDTDSAYDPTLGGLLDNYQSSLLGIFGEESSSGDEGNDEGSGEQGGGEQGGGDAPAPTGTITCSFSKSGTPSNSFFTVNGNGSDSKGKVTVDGVEYTTCLKMESATTIDFTLTDKRKMTLYFGESETASIKINGNKITGSGSIYSQVMEPGSYTLTKDKSVNLFYIKLEPVTESE